MKAVGVIVEYNPFHNGHKYHLDQAKKQNDADLVIAVMSGNFLQRGEPALVSKWSRTKMALNGGADLIFELPYRFATQNADIFANGAVSILEAACCDSFCFGSESGDLKAFTDTIWFLKQHETLFQEKVKEYSSSGLSYPKSVSLSFQSLSANNDLLDLEKPNNILGLQYVAAVERIKAAIKPQTITRVSAEFHDEEFSSESIASATSIRKNLFKHDSNQIQEIKPYLPSTSYDLLLSYKKAYGQFHSWENYWEMLKYKLIQSSPGEIREIHEVEEGLENRMLEAVHHTDSFQSFMESIKTKRYTWTRLQRVCLHILNNVKKEEMTPNDQADYLRLLGMTGKGREYLRNQKKKLGLPLISKLSANKKELDLDIRTSRVYSLGLPRGKQNDLMKLEFSQPPIQLQK